RLLDRGNDLWVRVTQDQRAPGADVIQVVVPVHVSDPAAPRLANEARFTAHALEGAHRAIHPARHQLDRAPVQFVGSIGGHGRFAPGVGYWVLGRIGYPNTQHLTPNTQHLTPA